MFCTSARSRARCCSRRRNAAASIAVVSAAVSWSVMSCLAWGMIRAGMVESGTIPASPHADPTRMAGQHHARILDGKGIAEDLLDSLKVQVDARLAAGKRRPGLAVVLVGADPASKSYVRNKRRAAQKAGIQAFDHDFPDDASEAELLALIERLNAAPAVQGLLVPLPLHGISATTRLVHRPAPPTEAET